MNDAGPSMPGATAGLEERVRRLTALAAFLTLGLVALTAWQFVPRPRTLEAQGFVLRDAGGHRRAEIGFRDDGSPGIKLFDTRQQTRVALYLAGEARGALQLRDADGSNRLRMELVDDGAPVIELKGGADGPFIELRIDPASRPALRVRDAGGAELWRAP